MNSDKNTAHLPKWWIQIKPTERLWLTVGFVLLLAALLWWVLLGPAIKTLRTAEAAHQKIDAQMLAAQSLSSQITELKSVSRLGFDAGYIALQSSTSEHLKDRAQVNLINQQAQVRIEGVHAYHLAQWLMAVRNNAKALPTEVKLRIDDGGEPSGSPINSTKSVISVDEDDQEGAVISAPIEAVSKRSASSVYWSGTVLFNLPPKE